ncbi:MAG: hypothetical protein EZS28_033247, partial [Streblomastix strix]
KITTFKQEVNVLQQTLGTATQDIGGLQQLINEINDELHRQTHFRGYYLLNTDIQNLPNSANGDFAFSAESGTVWMYDQSWYNSGDIVPDQVTPASDATPLVDSGTGVAGTSNEYSRGDHKHPLQVSDVLPSKDTSVATVEQASSYARSDHQHPIQTVNTIPVSDSADGSYGTVDSYARNDHSHPINVQTNASLIPIVDGVGNNGTSAYYSRHDHIHPQQLTYDGNVTATKFIKTGGTDNEILCANGDTTTKNGIKSQNFPQDVGATAKYIKLCRFGAFNRYGDINVEFKFYFRGNFNELKLHITYDTAGLNLITHHYLQQINHASFRLPTMLYYGSSVNKYGELWMTVGDYQGNQGRIDLLSQTIYGSPVVSDMLTNQIVDTLPSDFTTKQDTGLAKYTSEADFKTLCFEIGFRRIFCPPCKLLQNMKALRRV